MSGRLAGEELGLTDADIVIRGTVALRLDLRAIERTIYVTGAVEGTAVRQCVRCIKYFEDPLAVSLSVIYEREPKGTAVPNRVHARDTRTTATPDGEEDRNGDFYYFTGDHLELAPMPREQLILAAPMQPLCSPECRGLCARCGQNLNEGLCRCSEEPAGGPFQVLRRG